MTKSNPSPPRPAAGGISLGLVLETAPCLAMFGLAVAGLAFCQGDALLQAFAGIGTLVLIMRAPARAAWPLLAAFCLGALRLLCPAISPQERFMSSLSTLPASLACRIRTIDTYAESPTIRRYQPDTLRITAEILQAREVHAATAPLQPRRTRVLLRTAYRNREMLRRLRPGQVLDCQGILTPLPGPGSPDHPYGLYLRSLGIAGSYRISEAKKAGAPAPAARGLRRRIQAAREDLACLVLDGMPEGSLESRMLLALSLGYGNVLDPDTRRSFILSGTIHVFAISGLHVGLFFALTVLLLQRCGATAGVRLLGAALLTVLYVCLTGITPSSLRALAMALLMIYAMLRHRPPLPLNTLGQIGLLSVLVNPGLLQNIGFLFSYTIVFFLLASIQCLLHLQAIFKERDRWLPRQLRRPGLPLADLASSLLSCVLAWGAGLGIAMRLDGNLCLFTPLVNFPLLPMIPVCLALVPLKIACCLVFPAGEAVCAAALSFLLRGMLLIAEWGSRLPGTVLLGSQPWESILLFYCGLVMLLAALPAALSAPSPSGWRDSSEGTPGPGEPR